MKSIIFSGLLLLNVLKAQVQDNYTIKMSIKADGIPAEYAAFGELEMVSYVKGEKTKTETSNMMFTSTVFFDGNTITTLSEAMGNKSGYTATKDEMDALDKNKEPDAKPKIEYFNDKRSIAGYECTKAIVTYLDKAKKEKQATIWFTEKLKPSASTIRKANKRNMPFDLSDLKGMPLAMESTMNMQGMEFKSIMIATEILTSAIDDSVFVPNSEGYKMMTFKEYQEKMRSNGGQK